MELKSNNECVAEALDSLYSAMVFDSRDWSTCNRDAWLYAIVVGQEDALDEIADNHGWSDESKSRLKMYHTAIKLFKSLHGFEE